MAESLQAPDGTPVDLAAAEQKFAEAMAAPPADADTPAPPKKAPREDQAAEQPKRRGRPPKSQRARTETASAPKLSEAEQEALTAKRAKSVAETAGMLAGGFLVAAKITGHDAFKADAYTFQALSPQIGDAAAEVAKYDPVMARFIDKSGGGKVTAYLGLATVALGLGSQLAANHGLVKPGFMNTSAPADIIAHYESEEPPDADAEQK